MFPVAKNTHNGLMSEVTGGPVVYHMQHTRQGVTAGFGLTHCSHFLSNTSRPRGLGLILGGDWYLTKIAC